MLAALACDLGHRAVRALYRVEDEQPVVVWRLRLRSHRTSTVAGAGGLDEPAAQVGIAKLSPLLVEREGAEILPQGQAIERHLSLEREQRGERAAVDLGEHAPAGRGRLVEQGQIRAPDIGHAAPAEHSEGHRPARLHSEVAQPHVILAQTRVRGRAVDTLAGQLEDARIEIAHHADEATYLFPRRGAAGHGPPTGGFVRRRARGGEAHRPSTYGIA